MVEKNEPTSEQKEAYMLALYSLSVLGLDPNSEEFQNLITELAKTYLLKNE